MVQLQVLGEAAADIELGIRKRLTGFRRVYDHVATGRNAPLHLDRPLRRFWRDMHAAMNHMCNVTEPACGNYSLNLFGHSVIGRVRREAPKGAQRPPAAAAWDAGVLPAHPVLV